MHQLNEGRLLHKPLKLGLAVSEPDPSDQTITMPTGHVDHPHRGFHHMRLHRVLPVHHLTTLSFTCSISLFSSLAWPPGLRPRPSACAHVPSTCMCTLHTLLHTFRASA